MFLKNFHISIFQMFSLFFILNEKFYVEIIQVKLLFENIDY